MDKNIIMTFYNLFDFFFESMALRQHGQNHLPLGGDFILRQSKWNHTMAHDLLSHRSGDHVQHNITNGMLSGLSVQNGSAIEYGSRFSPAETTFDS